MSRRCWIGAACWTGAAFGSGVAMGPILSPRDASSAPVGTGALACELSIFCAGRGPQQRALGLRVGPAAAPGPLVVAKRSSTAGPDHVGAIPVGRTAFIIAASR